MKKKVTLIGIVLCVALGIFLIWLGVSRNAETEESKGTQEVEEKESSVTVYMSSGLLAGGSGSGAKSYVSQYRIGECWNYTAGSMLYDEAIQKFEKETQIKVHVKTFDSQVSLEEQLLKDAKQGQLPDVVISDAGATEQTYAFTTGQYATDLTPYLADREEASRFEVIEQACVQGEQQYILPLLFNLNAVYTAKEDHTDYISFEDALMMFEDEMNRLWIDADVAEAVYAVPTGNPNTISYMLWNAIGGSRPDDETGKYHLDEPRIKALFSFVKRYQEFEKDFQDATGQGVPYRASYVNDGYLQPFFTSPNPEAAFSFYSGYIDHVSYWLDGVSACNWPPTSMALQAQFYSSQLSQAEKSLTLLPISQETARESYNANITYFGFVPQNKKNRDAAVEFLLYLQDYTVDPRFGFSVNQDVTEKGLEKLTKVVWDIHDFTMSPLTLGHIEPLPMELKERISHILSKIDSASLPNGTIEFDIVYDTLQQYIEGQDWDSCLTTMREKLDSISISLDLKITDGVPAETSDRTSDETSDETSAQAEGGPEKVETETVYTFYPADMSKYEGQEILYFGLLNCIDMDKENLEPVWTEWNDYLKENQSPYAMQLITCKNQEKIFDERMLEAAEEELGIRFDIVAFLAHNFSAADREEHFEPVEAYFQTELKEAYESLPVEYWELVEENGHVYSLFRNFFFHSFACIYKNSLNPENAMYQALTDSSLDPEDAIGILDEAYQYCAAKESKGIWYLPDGWTQYLQNSIVSIPFHSWRTETYFDDVAPLVGIDYLGGKNEIICLLDSPVFQKITDLYRVMLANGRSIDDWQKSDFIIGDGVGYLERDETDQVAGSVYYNRGFNDNGQCICIRKDTPKLQYVLDFVNHVISEPEYARRFYMVEEERIEIPPIYCNRYMFITGHLDENKENLIVQAKKTPLTGFVFDNASVEEEIVAIQNYLIKSPAFARLEDTDNWQSFDKDMETFRREIYDLGLQKIIDEANRQYTEWQKTQSAPEN